MFNSLRSGQPALAVISAIYIAGLCFYILAGIRTVPFHGDEATFIYMTNDYADLFIQRDTERIFYQPEPPDGDFATRQQLRLSNGVIFPALAGFAWHVRGFSTEDLNGQWDWGGDWDYNLSTGRVPSGDLLRSARAVSALLTAAAVPLIFWLGKILGGYPAAYSAALLFALHPALLLNGRRAMSEGGLIFFALLVVLAGCVYIRRPSYQTALILGAAIAGTVLAKHNTVITAAAVFIGCALAGLYAVYRADDSRRALLQRIGHLLAAGLLALGLHYALNVAWWPDPAGAAGAVIDYRDDLLTMQTAVFNTYAGPADAVRGFFVQSLTGPPQYYEVPGWDAWIGEQIAAYESSLWRGFNPTANPIGLIVMLVCMGVGMWRIAQLEANGARFMIGAWALGVTVFIVAVTPLEWQRYYLQIHLIVIVLAGTGAGWLLRMAFDRVRARSR